MRHNITMAGGGLRLVVLLAGLVATGCAPQQARWKQLVRYDTATPTSGARARSPQRFIIGHSVKGREIECAVYGHGSETVLLLASIHGNEAAGTPLLERVGQHLGHVPHLLEGRRVILVPIVNPDGVASNRRLNARNVDLNRNFPAENFDKAKRHGALPLSEPESRALHRLLQTHPPDRIVSLHEPLACVDYDGPGEDLAQHLAAAGPLPVRKLGGRPGSLGSYAGELLKVPIITLELPATAARMDIDELWTRYGAMLLAAIEYDPPQQPAAPRRSTTLRRPHGTPDLAARSAP